MKTSVFNLSKFRKQAYYEDAKGLMQTQSRSWMNCYKMKVDAGITPQKAIDGCMAEYQEINKGEWAVKYASVKN